MAKLEWLRKPATAFVAMAIGAVIGIADTTWAMRLAPVGELYLTFLKMLVIPVMVTAVVTSLGKLLASREAARYLKRIAATFFTGLLVAALVGLGTGLIGAPGSGLDRNAREVIGNVLMQEETANRGIAAVQGEFTLFSFLFALIPSNLFQAIAGEQNLQVLFVAVMFGIAVGTVREKNRDVALGFFEAAYKAFEKMIAWSLYGLPAALLCMIAEQAAGMGVDLLGSLLKLILCILAASLLLMAGSAAVIRKTKKRSVLRSTLDLKEPLLIAFGTRNSLATLPFIFQALQQHYRVKEETANLVAPLSIILCRYSIVTMFAVGTLFIAQLYGIPLGPGQLAMAVLGSVFASVAGAGAPLFVSLSMISFILTPLGLPSETAIVLLMAVAPILDPVLTMLNVHLACSSSILIDQPGGRVKEAIPSGQAVQGEIGT